MVDVSVITPCRNEGRFVQAAIESVRKQTGVTIEHVVVDGGSSDETLRILRGYADQVRWVSEPDESPAEAVSKGLHMTSGDVIGWLNADDLYSPQAVTTVRDYFREHTDVDVVYGGFRHVNQHYDVLQSIDAPPWSIERLRKRCFLSLPAVFFRRRVVDQWGGPDPQLAYHADYEFWLRLASAGVRFTRLDQVLGDRRVRPNSRRLGCQCPKHRAAAAGELNEILTRTNGRVPQRMILRHADAQAQADGLNRNRTIGFDWAIMKLAARAERKLNRRYWSFPLSLVGLVCRHAGKEFEHMVRRPHLATRFLPWPLRGWADNLLRHKIFRTRHYAPRPIRLPKRYRRAPTLADPPVISIVTPNLDNGAYLSDAIRSVVGQGYPKLEYFVQDGGSTDNSLAVIREHEHQLAGWDSASDGGQSRGINRGMRQTTGEIMAYLNSDDMLLPGSLAYVARYLQEHPGVDVVYGHRLMIDEQGREIGRWVLPGHDDKAIAYADYIPQETMFWRRRAWERAGGELDESFQFALDWDLILRFRAAGMRFVRLPRFLGAFRITEQQKTTQLIQTVGAGEMSRLRRRELGHDPTRREVREALRRYMWGHWWCDMLYGLGIRSY